MNTRPHGYSLIEVLVAAAVLAVAIAGAAAMALAVVTQQETNTILVRAINHHEQAARLYQLGIPSGAINAILPSDPAVTSLSFNSETQTAIAGLGTVEQIQCVIVFKPAPATTAWSAGSWTAGDPSLATTNSLIVVRPTIR